MKKLHFCYLTQNKVNNKIYFGKHSTTNLNDGYIGSGKLLQQAVNKYGDDSFEVVQRWFFDTEALAYLYEAEIVTENFINRSDTYNLSLGGLGGVKTDEIRQKISNTLKGRVPEHVQNSTVMTNGVVNKYVPNNDVDIYLTNGYTIGITPSQKAIEAYQQRNQQMSNYQIRHPDGTISTVTNQAKFARDHNLSGGHLTRMRNGKLGNVKGYTLVDPLFKYQKKGKKVHTPDGVFDTTGDAAKHYNTRMQTIQYRVNNKLPQWSSWYYEE